LLSLAFILNRARLLCYAALADHTALLSSDLNSMQHSPSGEANSSSTCQEIPRNSWNQKVYYLVHKIPSLVPIRSQINPVHVPHSIPLKLILLSSSHLRIGLPSGLFPSGSPHRNSVCISPPSHTCYMLCPSHFSLFYHPNNIW
jgi:hypothetical protein